MLQTDLLTFGVAAAVLGIAGGMRRLPAYFDNPAYRGSVIMYTILFLLHVLAQFQGKDTNGPQTDRKIKIKVENRQRSNDKLSGKRMTNLRIGLFKFWMCGK